METVLTQKQKKYECSKKIFMLMLMVLICSASLFAKGESGNNTTIDDNNTTIDGINTIKSVFNTIYSFFTSAAVRVIAIAGVIFTGIKIITNKGNTEALKPLIGILLACIVIGSASWFVDKFMGTTIKSTSTIGGTSWY